MMLESGSVCTDGKDQRLQIFKGTRLCKFNAMGRCKRGLDCKFSHTDADLKELPDFSKTRLCEQFMAQGFCRLRDRCKFAHGKEQLRSRTEAMPEDPVSHDGPNHMASTGTWDLLQVAVQVQQQISYEQAALNLLLMSAARFSCAAAKPQSTAIGDDDFWDEASPLSRQSTCIGEDCSLPAFSRNTTGQPFSHQSMERAIHWECKVSESSEVAYPVKLSAESEEVSMPELVMVKNTFIHVETQDEAAPKHLRRVCSAPALWISE